MKNLRIILVALIAAAIGLGAGYALFHKSENEIASNENHNHATTQPATRPDTSGQPATEYTCSMHPQVRQNESGICPICEMDLIPVGDKSSQNNDPTILEMTHEAVKLANIQTTVVGQTGKLSNKSLSLNGKIQMDERRSASLVSHIPGRIEQLFVASTGEAIKKGQKLANIYSAELITAQRELLEAIKI